MKRLLLALAGAGVMLTGPAMAKSIPDGGVTAEDVAAVLRADGYKAEMSKDGAGDPMIISGVGGHRFVVMFYDCKNDRCPTYQMVAGFEVEKKPTLEKINEWNHKHRFGRAYIDKDKDPIVEMDIDAEKGFTTEAISNNLATWEAVLGGFVQEFGL